MIIDCLIAVLKDIELDVFQIKADQIAFLYAATETPFYLLSSCQSNQPERGNLSPISSVTEVP